MPAVGGRLNAHEPGQLVGVPRKARRRKPPAEREADRQVLDVDEVVVPSQREVVGRQQDGQPLGVEVRDSADDVRLLAVRSGAERVRDEPGGVTRGDGDVRIEPCLQIAPERLGELDCPLRVVLDE